MCLRAVVDLSYFLVTSFNSIRAIISVFNY
jgi:hypothetical protein